MLRILYGTILIFIIFISTSVFAKERIVTIQDIGKIDVCTIAGIDDGDTFNLDCINGYYLNVRLMGVNAPDFNQKKGIKNCFFDEAKKYIREKKGTLYNVNFYGSDLCKDTYKGCRNIVQLFDTETRGDLAESMLKKGFVLSWTNFSNIPEKIKNRYTYLEAFSRKAELGLWKSCEVIEHIQENIDSSEPVKMTQPI